MITWLLSFATPRFLYSLRKFCHFVFVTKYRYKVLSGDVAHRLREVVRQTREQLELHILRGVVSRDHVHLFVAAPPKWSASEIMRRVKGRSARKLFEEFPRLKKRYWGKHLWARGYFCVTSGELTQEMVEQYLEHHFRRRGDDNFEVE